MNKSKIVIFLFRVALGWIYLYNGWLQITNPKWTAYYYLSGAKLFTGFFHWLASPENIQWVNFINKWSLIIIGSAIILGLLVRWAAYGGIALTILYYLVILQFPHIGQFYFLVNEHIIFVLGFGLLISLRAGEYWGLDGCLRKLKVRKLNTV